MTITVAPNGPAPEYTADPARYDGATFRRAGASGILLPRVSLGLWQNFGADRDPYGQRRIVLHAFDRGITHFDLANNYGPPYGAAEQRFGDIVRSDLRRYRDEILVTTKAGYDMWPGPYGDGGSRKYLLSSLDQSLARLNLDYVDVFYSHRPDPDTRIEETVGALASAVSTGKALYVGLSNYDSEQTEEALAALAAHGLRPLLHQPRYSLFDRTPEGGLFTTLERHGIGAAVFSPLAQGLLTGKYLDGSIPDTSRAAKSHYLDNSSITEDYLQRISRIAEVAASLDVNIPVVALAWVLNNPVVTTAIVGASRTSQIDDALSAASFALPPDAIAGLESAAVSAGADL